ncbi:MAG: dephospho-CoA kinase [Pseudomonadota bacterium]|nr:dephospho-CoA kinase [Pseudomonadota bacterium]
MASPLRIGLTGGIGSGKSTVASMLVAQGAALIDTDAIARALTLPGGAAIDAIRAAFGDEFIATDGGLDRARMRSAAFADPGDRRKLEVILHPRIGAEVEQQVAASSADVLVLDIPLLVESGRWRARVDRVCVVDCSEAVQVQRVVARSGLSESAVRAVIAQQATRASRRAAADAVLHNEGISVAALARDVEHLWHRAFRPRAMADEQRGHESL